MSQEIKTIVRTITAAGAFHVDQEISMLCAQGGWSLHTAEYIRMEKGGHDILYVLVREAPTREVKLKVVEPEPEIVTTKRGPGRPANI